MTRARKWLVGLGAVVGVLLVPALIGLSLLPRDEALAQRTAQALSAAAGVPVTVGALQWQVFPTPRVVIENIATEQPRPIMLKKIMLYPNLKALWQRRLQVDRVLIEGAVVPQLSMVALGAAERAAPPALPWTVADLPLARFEFRDVTWLSRRGIPVIDEGEVEFDPQWRPRTAGIRRPGIVPTADLSAIRQGQDERWAIRINVGGGTATGALRLQITTSGRLRLDGALQPRDIDTAAARVAFNRKPVVAGKAAGTTTVSAEGASVARLAGSLHTQSGLRISRARLLGFDLEKAVRSAGTEHAGTTPLDTLTLQLDTQNTGHGSHVQQCQSQPGRLDGHRQGQASQPAHRRRVHGRSGRGARRRAPEGQRRGHGLEGQCAGRHHRGRGGGYGGLAWHWHRHWRADWRHPRQNFRLRV